MTLFPFSQRQENSRHPMSALLAATVLFAGAGSAESAVMGIDSVTTSPALSTFPTAGVNNEAVVTGITINGDDFIVDDTATVDGSSPAMWWASDANQPSTDVAAMSGSVITEGALNVDKGAVFTFSREVTDDDWIFITELNGDQDVTIKPTDAGNAISTWELDIAAGDWGGSLFTLDDPKRSDNNHRLDDPSMNGVAFQLGDFTGGTGTLTGVNGIEIDKPGRQVDISVVGLAVIPEPATVGLIAIGSLMTLGRRRRA